MSALIYNSVYNLTVALATNPFLSFPKYDDDIDDLLHLKLILDTYKAIFAKDSELLPFSIPIDTIIDLLFQAFQYYFNHDILQSKQSFNRMMNILVEHYSLFIHHDEHLPEKLTLLLTINPFYDFERTLVFHKKEHQYIPTYLKKERLLLNYWFWFPVLLAASPISQYTSTTNISHLCNELLKEWLDNEAEQTNLEFDLELPTVNPDQINTLLSESLFTYFYKTAHQRDM